MSIIKNLWWFFKEEKKRYLIGILSLSLVAVLNLIPPKIMGSVIDAITTGKLTRPQLLWNLLGLVLSALAMYGLRYIWRMYILGTSYKLGQVVRYRLFEHFTKMSPSFYQKYRTGDLMAHATNDINSLTRLAGGGSYVSSGCLYHSISNAYHHVLYYFVANDINCGYPFALNGLSN